jgi:hypothetical protein
MCPYYLDGDLAVPDPKVEGGSVIPVFDRPLIDGRSCGFCAVFKDRGEADRAGLRRLLCERAVRPHVAGGERRSLKTQQHALR